MKTLSFTILFLSLQFQLTGQTIKESKALESKIDLSDIKGLLSLPPFWMLRETFQSGKKVSVNTDNVYIFRQDGIYIEYLNAKLRKGIWNYDDGQKALVIEFFDTQDRFRIHRLNKDELILEKQNGDTFSFSSGQYMGGAQSYGLERELGDPKRLTIPEIRKQWEDRRKEEMARELTIIECDDFSDGIAMIANVKNNNDKQYGYINELGEYVAKPSYEKAFPFSSGFGLVKTFSHDDEYLFLNVKGENIFSKAFSEARSFKEGLAAVKDENWRWGFIDAKGELVIKPQYSKVDDFADGMARIMQDDKWGYIDTKGNEVFIPQFNCANNFSEGFALVGQFVNYHFTQYSFVDKSGKIAFKVNRENGELRVPCCSHDYDPRLDHRYKIDLCNFQDGVAVIAPSAPSESFIFSKDGKRNRISQEDVRRFNEGLAVARKVVGKKYGFINNKGAWQIDPIFDLTVDFNEGMAAVQINENWGFVDKSGTVVINKDILNSKTNIQSNPPFKSVSDFSEGLAVVEVRGKFGYLDKDGKWVIKAELVGALPFKNGKARVLFENRSGWNFIDKNGKILFPAFQ